MTVDWAPLYGPTPSHGTLRYGTHFQRSTQFYLPPTGLSTNGMNHTCLCLPNRSSSSLTDPGRMEGWVGLDTTMANKRSAQGPDFQNFLRKLRKILGILKLWTYDEVTKNLGRSYENLKKFWKSGPMQDCYVTEITVISCWNRHTSPGNWKRSWLRASISRPLGPTAAMLTTTPPLLSSFEYLQTVCVSLSESALILIPLYIYASH